MKMQSENWEWHEQYEFDPDDDMDVDEGIKLYSRIILKPNVSDDRNVLDQNAYYCNKELVQLLVFDAKVSFETVCLKIQFFSSRSQTKATKAGSSQAPKNVKQSNVIIAV